MTYIEQEQLVITSGTTYYLDNSFKDGTTLVEYNDVLLYEYREVAPSGIVFDFAPIAGDEILVSYYISTTPNVQNTVRYTTPEQVRNKSRADLTSITDADLEKIIREAERLVDQYCGPWEKINDYTGQKQTFPRYVDSPKFSAELSIYGTTDYAAIPQQITLATVYATEYLYLKGTPTADNLDASSFYSESMLEYTYRKSPAAQDLIAAQIGMKAAATLRGFRKNYGKMKVKDDRFQDQVLQTGLNSRELFLRSKFN